MISFITVQPNLKDRNISIYDFLPLEGDPTEQEISALKVLEEEKLRDKWAQAIKFYEEGGFIKKNSIILA